MPPPTTSLRTIASAIFSSGPLLRTLLFYPLIHGWTLLRQCSGPTIRGDRAGFDRFLYEYARHHRQEVNLVLRPFNRHINTSTGMSMRPTCTGDREIIWTDTYYQGGRDIGTGDVVTVWVLAAAGYPGAQLWMKRVMGLEGNEYIKKTPRRGAERMKVGIFVLSS